MTLPYAKSFLDIPGQVALLQSRGLDIGDHATAERLLAQYGYYRLSGYWHPLRKSALGFDGSGKPAIVYSDEFVLGATLDQAIGLAEFDRRLRALFLEAIERIEVAIRVSVALLLGPRGPWAHRQAGHFYPKFATQPNPRTGVIPFHAWLARLDDHEQRSKEQFTTHYRAKYGGPLPLWISIEVWDFGMLSKLVGGMTVADQQQLASSLSVVRRPLLPSWLRAINHIRNVAAHHSRLWNRSPADQPVPPRPGEFALLEPLAKDSFAHSRLYAVAAIMQYMLRIIDPNAAIEWSDHLKAHFATFPEIPGVAVGNSGFPLGWEASALWN
ncbi:abortive infection bacteriophage resistance protein [Novosphingobium chloroacetimidivorans]|uniref:Abortive infection bacteriophage resistance protein n=1 Tax=Novosphingobium chloroacetimidivorans TaxID=1428314 RepID=A0A7W7KAK1_9SPHN|nr:Abi family protein [Novosphingobium chloroacetimidivorans]MBB4859241.1 abortive infection bacteriophage resistance protein [Novosphingobium chloroacetimidivorans]